MGPLSKFSPPHKARGAGTVRRESQQHQALRHSTGPSDPNSIIILGDGDSVVAPWPANEIEAISRGRSGLTQKIN